MTGFKYIGQQILGFEEKGKGTYLFGFEESYGYLAGPYVRDKDAVIGSMLICEMAAYYKEKGMTLYEALLALYEKYGYFREGVKSLTMKGLEGMEEAGVKELAAAAEQAVKTAYKAVMKPKEGTILTVARGCAEAAEKLKEQGMSI